MINWREYPFTKLLFPFVSGIALAIYFEVGNVYLLSAICCGLLVILFISYRIRGNIQLNSFYWVGIQISFLILGYVLTFDRNELNQTQHFQQNVTAEAQSVLGIVSDMPVKKGEKIKLVLSVKAIHDRKESKAAIGNILIYIPNDSLSQTLAYGDQISINGYLQKIPPPTNPDAFDYRQYLYYKNIHYQAFIKAGHWQILGENEGNLILKTAFHFRNDFINVLRKYLKNDNKFSVGSALILGYKDEITEEIRSAYAGTGAMHVLAVSGLHVGLVFLILNALLQIFNSQQILWKILRVVLLLIGIWAFAILTGASPSVLRATTMFSFVTIGMNLRQPTNIYNTLAGSAFFLLFYNPLLLMNVGFQMSYLAVIGIVYFQPKFAEIWTIKNRIGNYLWQLVTVSLAAQLMTFPLGLFYFHQFPCFFWLSGLVVVPAAGVILAAGLGLFLIETIVPGWGAGLGYCLNALIEVVNYCIFLIHQLPLSTIQGIWINGFMAILLYLILFTGIVTYNTKRWKWMMVCCGFFAFSGLNFAFKNVQNNHTQKIVVYDVYKNSLIDFIDGTHCYAFQNETIPEKTVSFAAQNHRWKMGVDHFDTLHFSSDSLHVFQNLKFKRGRIQFVNQDFAIIDAPLTKDFDQKKIKLNYILIRNTPDLEIATLLEYFDFEKIIFDGSNKNWQVKKWQQKCDELNISNWYTAENGAFILEIE